MMKAGAAKTADIMIPQEQKMFRARKFIEIHTTVSVQASQNLNYNMTMFAKEYDFIRYLRMSNRSEFLKSLYSKVI